MLLGASALPASAQQQSVLSIEAAVGFSGVFRAGAWTPVYITAQNLGQDIAGTLLVQVERGNRFGDDRTVVTYRRDLELVSGASKAFAFVLPIQTTVYPVIIQIVDGDEILFEQQVELSGKSAPGRLVAVLARRPNLDFLLPLFNSRDERSLDIAYPLVELLPEDWHGYDGIDLLVMHDARLPELSERQVRAMETWIASGGRLVISGGTFFGPADAEALAPLIELTPAGIDLRRVEAVGLLEVGLPLEPGEREQEVVVAATQEYGTTVSRIRLGGGDIVILPFDYVNLVHVAPVTSIALWDALIGDRSTINPVPTEMRRRVFEDELIANQLSLPVYRFPSHGLVIGLIASYLIAVISLLYWISNRRSLTRRLIGVPAILLAIGLVGLAAYAALTVSLQPDEALALSLERATLRPDENYAYVTRDTALFSRQAGEYEVSHTTRPLLMPLDNRNQSVGERSGARVSLMETENWGHSNSLAIDMVTFEMDVHIDEAPDFTAITLTNRSGRDVTGITVLHGGFPQKAGDLRSGETLEFIADPDSIAAFQQIDWEAYIDGDTLRANRTRMLGDIARAQFFARETSPEILIVGWLDEELIPVEVNPPFDRTVTLGVLSIPIELQRGDVPEETS
jgi:hypothetical protein